MSGIQPSDKYEVCGNEGCEKPVAYADPREEDRGMNFGGNEYCSLGCRLDDEEDANDGQYGTPGTDSDREDAR